MFKNLKYSKHNINIKDKISYIINKPYKQNKYGMDLLSNNFSLTSFRRKYFFGNININTYSKYYFSSNQKQTNADNLNQQNPTNSSQEIKPYKLSKPEEPKSEVKATISDI